MTVVALLNCCPCPPCSVCGVSSWTASGFGGGILEWVAECEESVVEGVGTFYFGVFGTISYTIPNSITLDFAEESGLCCTWFGETAWVETGPLDHCADCGSDLTPYPYDYRFKTEATLTICETSEGSGIYEAALLVVVRCEYKTATGSWTSFNIVGPPFGGSGDAAAWCRWTQSIDPGTWCPDGGDLTDGDGLAPTFGGESQVPEGDCANLSPPGKLVNTSTLDWGGTPGDVTIA